MENTISGLIESRRNVVTGRIEIRYSKKDSFKPMTDWDLRTILRSLKRMGYKKASTSAIRDILDSNFSPNFNPFEEYFMSLEDWDGETDHIAELASLLKITNHEYLVPWFKKWFVGLVTGLLDAEQVNHQVLVLTGAQGIGKTTFFNVLVPKELRGYYFNGFVNPSNKDAVIQSSECFLITMDELASLKPTSIESLKQLITQKFIRVRRPYAVNPETLDRRASFAGTTNEKTFLEDSTGSRRFLCFNVESVNLVALKTFDIGKAYAQAFSLYLDGYRYWFNKEETRLIEENNEEFVVRSQEEELIREYFVPTTPDLLSLKWTATMVTNHLASKGLIYNSAKSVQNIGKALSRLGFQKRKSNGQQIYDLKRI